jgi:MSHA biogenesis protein MshL
VSVLKQKKAVIFGIIINLSGCQTTPPQSAQPPSALSENPKTLDNLPLAVERDLYAPTSTPPLLASPLAPNPTPERRFNIAANEVPVGVFLANLVADSSVNLVIHPEVKGKVTLSLQHVTLNGVLDAIRDVYGYDVQRDGRLIQIYPAGFRTESFVVDYLLMQRQAASNTHINAARQFNQETNENDASGSGTSISSVSNTDFWSELQTSLAGIIGSTDGRTVVVTPQASLVTVRAMPAELRQVRRFLQQAVEHLQRQVILEAKIMEVTLNKQYQRGIHWEAILGGQKSQFEIKPSSKATELMKNGLPSSVSNVFKWTFNKDDKHSFAAVLSLLDTQGDVEVLSSPRVTATNNQKAVIKVGEDITFTRNYSRLLNQDQDNRYEWINPTIETEAHFSGISLDVTPQIDDQGSVLLHIHPSVVTVTRESLEVTSNGEQTTISVPKSQIRESDSVIKAVSGDVIVIGGLMQTYATETEHKVPFLGDIPLLGALFTHYETEYRKKELIIVLKPTVVRKGTWAQALADSKRLLERWEGQ